MPVSARGAPGSGARSVTPGLAGIGGAGSMPLSSRSALGSGARTTTPGFVGLGMRSSPLGRGVAAGNRGTPSRSPSPTRTRSCWDSQRSAPHTSSTSIRESSPSRQFSRTASPSSRPVSRPAGSGSGGQRRVESPSAESTALADAEDADDLQEDSAATPGAFRREGGLRRRAYDDLMRNDPRQVRMHDVPAVQKMASGVDRVAVKLTYLRGQDELIYALTTPIEQEYMTMEPISGSMLVDIGKMRCKSKPGKGPTPTHSDKQTHSFRTSSRAFTPDVLASRLQDRSERHSARVRQAVESARELDMQRRLERQESLELRQARHGLAVRARPWLVWVVTSAAMVALRRTLELYYAGLSGTCELQASSGFINSPHDYAFEVLHRRYVEVVQRLIIKTKLDSAEERKTSKVWGYWAHGLRVSVWLVRMMVPIRKHRLIKLCKQMMSDTLRAYSMRMVIKGYLNKIRFWQRVFKSSHDIMWIVRTKVLEPLIWVAETQILGRAVGMTEDMLSFEIAKYLDVHEVEAWRAKAKRLIDNRPQSWHGLPVSPMEVAGPRALNGGGKGRNTVLTAEPVGAAKTTTTSRMPLKRGLTGKMGAEDMSDAAPRRQQESQDDHALQSSSPNRVGKFSRQKTFMPGLGEGLEEPMQGMTPSKSTPGGIGLLDKYRMSQTDRQEVSRLTHCESLESWWQQYKAYKTLRARSTEMWKGWSRVLAELNMDERLDQEMRPEPPQTPEYPAEILRTNMHLLESKVLGYLKQKQRDGFLTGLHLTLRSAAAKESKDSGRLKSTSSEID